MTKDVELHSSTWKTMKQAITGLTENSTISSSGYGNYTNAQAGAYGIGTASTGFAKRVEELVKISEKVQRLIAEKDTDGAVSYSYHDDTSTAQTLQSKLSTLERYAGNVPTYIKDKIDHPFYEAMDKVGAKLEALNIQQYKTTNKVGYKRIESMTDPYGHPVGTKEVVPTEIGIDELYKVDSPYRTALQKSYEEFKKSKDYQDHKLTETEYVQAMHQTRAFEYVSIDDEKSKIEMWRDIALGVGLVVLTIFCPPAGAVAGVALASADMYSAATGKDWGTGRELDTSERTLRGTFALFDLIPAGKYLGTLAKTGKTAGLTAVKNSLQTTLKEGLEQGAKNLDSFKAVLKNAKGLGDNVYHSLSTYRKQITHQLKNSVDEKVLNLSKATQEGLERAKQFTLEVPTVRVVQEASTGSQMMMFEKTSKSLGDTGLGKSLDNLVSKAKNVENARLDKLRARNAFYTTKEEWMKAMKEGDVFLHTDVHSKIEILKQRGIISEVDDGTIELISNMRKGNYGEMTTDEIYRQLGYERISLDMTTEIDGATHLGIDGVYHNPNGHPPYIIAEAKYGSARLSYLKNPKIKQMSHPWVERRLKDAVGGRNFEEIVTAMDSGDVGYQLVKVRKNGDIMINNLDKKANIIRP
ncbi:pre-toxin TG domain-containing protein [Streptococcus mitis]|uniref:Uncharacterized protein n=1 Tax=Streptococcus mitis TaxID=28037 RepID=A0A3R9JH57_STRMT|nr:pre-toxin TG domain-containing protein [Streptococcus mitis]RSI90125.1 hypothetical protein D8845_08875 [Streptococcus mitis]